MKSDDKHNCADMIDKFESLVRQHELNISGFRNMSTKKFEELNHLRWEIKKLLSIACANDFGYADVSIDEAEKE